MNDNGNGRVDYTCFHCFALETGTKGVLGTTMEERPGEDDIECADCNATWRAENFATDHCPQCDSDNVHARPFEELFIPLCEDCHRELGDRVDPVFYHADRRLRINGLETGPLVLAPVMVGTIDAVVDHPGDWDRAGGSVADCVAILRTHGLIDEDEDWRDGVDIAHAHRHGDDRDDPVWGALNRVLLELAVAARIGEVVRECGRELRRWTDRLEVPSGDPRQWDADRVQGMFAPVLSSAHEACNLTAVLGGFEGANDTFETLFDSYSVDGVHVALVPLIHVARVYDMISEAPLASRPGLDEVRVAAIKAARDVRAAVRATQGSAAVGCGDCGARFGPDGVDGYNCPVCDSTELLFSEDGISLRLTLKPIGEQIAPPPFGHQGQRRPTWRVLGTGEDLTVHRGPSGDLHFSRGRGHASGVLMQAIEQAIAGAAGQEPEDSLCDQLSVLYVEKRGNDEHVALPGGWILDACPSGCWFWCNADVDWVLYATPDHMDPGMLALQWSSRDGDPIPGPDAPCTVLGAPDAEPNSQSPTYFDVVRDVLAAFDFSSPEPGFGSYEEGPQ